MKKIIVCLMAIVGSIVSPAQAKDLVVYFSAQGHTKAVAEEIARIMGADILRIEAADPYAANPYDDSERVKEEAYNDLRPGVANLPAPETIAQYDRLFVGSPIWWHQPAMVVCTFLEHYDLSGKVIVPFFTYGATTYLNEAMHKIYKVTPNSQHVPATLPEDLNPDDITTPGPADDEGIDMPGNARGVENWLRRLGLIGNETAIGSVAEGAKVPFEWVRNGNTIEVNVAENVLNNVLDVYQVGGAQVFHGEHRQEYSLSLPLRSAYLLTLIDAQSGQKYNCKIVW